LSPARAWRPAVVARLARTLGIALMAYDVRLAQRVRGVLGETNGVSERAMFGGLAFLVDGKVFV
jgi:hypothetical protein